MRLCHPRGASFPSLGLLALVGFAGLGACKEEANAPVARLDSTRECKQAELEPGEGDLALVGMLKGAAYYRCEWPRAERGASITNLQIEGAVLTGIPTPFQATWTGADRLKGRTILLSLGPKGYYSFEATDDAQPFMGALTWNEGLASGDRLLRMAILNEGATPLEPKIGQSAEAPVYLISVGTGDIQINLHWNALVDLDVYVRDPSGFVISYSDRTAPSGGELDLDSYPACAFEGDRGRGNENVFWPDDEAPPGEYEVAVNLYDACGVSVPIPYRVTVAQNRTQVETFEGTFGANAAFESTQIVTTFTRP